MKEVIYWDSDPFLAWFQEEAGKVELCEGVVDKAQRGELIIVTSALTLAEVLYRRGKGKIPADKRDMVVAFFKNEFIAVRNVTRFTAEQARDLVWDHDIAPKDAVHVATALEAKVSILETFDNELLRKTGTVGNPPLTIRRPTLPAQGSLFR